MATSDGSFCDEAVIKSFLILDNADSVDASDNSKLLTSGNLRNPSVSKRLGQASLLIV